MEIYDEIAASSVEVGDQIVYSHDVLEVTAVVDETDAILIKGYSHNSGDNECYLLSPDTTVFLWRA